MKKLIDDNELMDNRVKKSPVGMLVGIIVILIVAAIVVKGVAMLRAFTSVVTNDDEKKGVDEFQLTMEVEQGDSVKVIADKLQNSGVIDSSLQFVYLCKKYSEGANFQPGNYSFTNYMDFNEICDILKSGRVDEEYITFTIKEGDTIKEIAENLQAQEICSADEFINACNSNAYDFDFVKEIPQRDNLLEGYLFPDTYFLTVDADANEVITKALARFDEMFTDEMKLRTQEIGKTVDEVVITASVIEGEVKYGEERPVVASVINNRLEKGMKLQMDATVLYALGEQKDRVLYSDLEIEDLHNTYYVKGLPVGPIGSPGVECINAVLNPADTDYLYYVVEDINTGKHYFTSNYDDFINASNNYKSQLDN